MGNCFGFEADEPPQEDLVARRERQAEAAMKRQKENESKGIKNPELLRAKQERREEIERRAEATNRQQGSGGGLKWTVG